MAGSEVFTRIAWTTGTTRRSFVVKSVRGGPLIETASETEAGAIARAEDDASLREHAAVAKPDEGEVLTEDFIMVAELTEAEPIFFGVRPDGYRLTPPSNERSVIADLLGRTPGLALP